TAAGGTFSLEGRWALWSFAADLLLAAAGGTFSLVETVDAAGVKKLWSFGANRFGQLGRAVGAGLDSTNLQPGVVPLSGELRQAAAGRHHALALTSLGLYSWGGNRFGQLGRGVNAGGDTPNHVPALVDAAMFMGEQVVGVRAGRMHTVVLTAPGTLFCFGSNLRGQCGPGVGGRNQPGSDAPNPVATKLGMPLFGGLPVVSVEVGQYHTIATTLDGKVWGFGRNFYGQLTEAAGGVGMGTPISTPLCLSCQAAGANLDVMSGVAGGSDHTSGGFSVDFVSANEAGFGCASSSPLDVLTGKCTAGSMEAIAIYAGCDASLALTRSSGTLRGLLICL
ncbi:regulator of chromosome condensation 1/beta-lactamase-inhibitor protein II, partial [Baffinella frigidus]